MKQKSIVDYKVQITIAALLVTALFVVREYFYGGVITHHLLADQEMPGASNWWGLLTIPVLTWVMLFFIERRQNKAKEPEQNPKKENSKVIRRFLLALCLGTLFSVLWEFRLEEILQYLILLPVVIAFFVRVHWPECLLGFVIGMMYAFGGILPILVGVVLMILTFVAYKVVRGSVLYVISKLK
ncbi:MAG: hypothetical protein ABJM06_09460 [Gilvibacter sp.]